MDPASVPALLESLDRFWHLFTAFAAVAACFGFVLIPLVLVANENWKRRV